jgi:hypothetical protein
MGYTLTAEQIQENWIEFNSIINKVITGDRKDKLLELYEEFGEDAALLPAAITKSNHNCIPGGYIDHILRVYYAAVELNKTWKSFEGHEDFTQEELAFVCLNHDLGKLGFPGQPGAFPNDNSWEVEKLGKMYKYNTQLQYFTVPDRGLFLLQSRGITMSEKEYLGIKLHDGLYEEPNKSYLVSYQPEARLRSYLPLLVHQADMLAARVEWEREWYGKFDNKPTTKPVTQTKKPVPTNSPKASQEALKRLGSSNPSIMNAFKNL